MIYLNWLDIDWMIEGIYFREFLRILMSFKSQLECLIELFA